jgi:hypothetical protein
MNGRMNDCMDEMDVLMEGWYDWMDGTDRWMDGWMDV